MTKKSILFFVILALIGLSACKPATPEPTATIDPAVLKTGAAQTASAGMTSTAQAVPTQTATNTPDLQQTAAIQTQTAQQTQAAAVTATPTTGVTAAVDQSLTDRAAFVQDVTVPDGADFKPGETFTKTWRLQNNGTSTWNSSYALVYISGDKMGGPDRVNLTANVTPGSQVDVSVKLTAPTQAGRYRGYWKMLNSASKFFDDAVYVEIDVVSGNTSTPSLTGTTTATVPSGATPTATATATATTGAVTISALSMSTDTPSFTGACPRTYTFTGRFTLSGPATVTYQIEAGSDTPGFTFTLPPAQTAAFNAGEQTVTFNLEFTQSVTGWTRLHITAPSDVASNQATFSLTCQP